jgi:hypothetical protein
MSVSIGCVVWNVTGPGVRRTGRIVGVDHVRMTMTVVWDDAEAAGHCSYHLPIALLAGAEWGLVSMPVAVSSRSTSPGVSDMRRCVGY